jgi:dTDP-4-amino-4,6-dideoxygalactose transaminase
MLVLRAMGLRGDVILPSFTFVATAHAVAWNGLRPVFADVDRETLTLDPESVRGAPAEGPAAVVATHVYGTPCDVEGLAHAAAELGVPLVFDAAHAFGSLAGGEPVGRFGDAEVFSLTPTKTVVGAEGGLVTTANDELAEACRIGRDYANPGDYDARFVGLNARLSEVHAAVALGSLDGVEGRVRERGRLAGLYREALADVPGMAFPAVRPGDRSTVKDMAVLVDQEGFGVGADALSRALAAEGVETRRYYSPPVHRMRPYRGSRAGDLPVTEWAAARALALPLWIGMGEAQVAGVTDAVRRIRASAPRGDAARS